MAEDRTREFAKRDPTWRIEAVIHDGSWYTVRKWAKLSKVKDNDIHEWIENNKEKTDLIHMNDSYRLGYDEIIRWYEPDLLTVQIFLQTQLTHYSAALSAHLFL